MDRLLNGEQALALGAVKEGITLATGYPGSPGGGIIDMLATRQPTLDAHWSVNEKVALERAIGVAINGHKALVCVKSVGLNAMLDPLTVVNLTPLTGALVIVVGDDPGGYGSQNDQDSRLLAQFLNLPWFEPAGPQQGYELMRLAFQLSESYGLAVFIRLTRSYASHAAAIDQNSLLPSPKALPLVNLVAPRFVPGPANAVAKNKELANRLADLQEQLDRLPINKFYPSSGRIGIVVCGHLCNKLTQVTDPEVLSDHAAVLFLQSIYPLPPRLGKDFLANVDRVVVLEENTPVIAHQLMQLAAQNKLSPDWQVETHPGEMFRWQIAGILAGLFPGIRLNPAYAKPVDEKPVMKNNCLPCRYNEVLDLFDECARKLAGKFHYYGDPGCLVTVVDRLQGKFAMGGSVATAFGAAKANPEAISIAFIGDSGFFHSALPAIIDAAWHGADLPLVLLNNNTALTTGGQGHPGTKPANNDKPLSYALILKSCGVRTVKAVDLDQDKSDILAAITGFVKQTGLRLLQINIS